VARDTELAPAKIPPRAMFITQIWGTIVGELQKLNILVSELNAIPIHQGQSSTMVRSVGRSPPVLDLMARL
jgi:hypothetical protein